MKHLSVRLWMIVLFTCCWFLTVKGISDAQLPPLFAPGRGVLDASLVVIVKPEIKDIYRTLETYLADPQAGELLYLPNLKLHILPNEKSVVTGEITPDTRLLLFLKHKTLDPTGWEVTFYGADAYAVESPEKVEELRTMAEEAIAVRREWDGVLSIRDERQRVEALWQLFLKKDIRVLRQTSAALKKLGAVASDYIMEKLETLNTSQRKLVLMDIGEYGSLSSHNGLVAYIKQLQQDYEMEAEKRRAEEEAFLFDDFRPAIIGVMGIPSELYCGIIGLSKFKNTGDLPFMRELARWGIKNQNQSVCDAVLDAFRAMPDKQNLPVIEEIWQGFNKKDLIPWEIVLALDTHLYRESVPLLVRFLVNGALQNTARRALKDIVGKDLGKEPQAWLDWYKAQKGKEEK